jgi:DNA-binding NtrC family response regulator
LRGRILVVDDEGNIRNALAKLLSKFGHEVFPAATAQEALQLLPSSKARVVLTDLRMPGMDGLSLLTEIKGIDPSVEVIVMTAFGSVDTAVEAMRQGAYDYIEKPINQERLPLVIDRALERQMLTEDNSRLRETVKTREEFGGLIGKAEAMTRLYELIEMVSPTRATVLILGESGVGKELIAQAIHQRGPRSREPLISLNCGAIPESLLESELFGFEKGAFTGADAARQGKIEMSDRGTLFLDEVGEMNPKTQIELLRVLETKELRRIGGTKVISVDLRVIAATNKKLSEEVAAGRFREDLFYRLNVVPLFVPPLRERREDIPMLAERFLEEFASTYHRPRKRLSRGVIELLMSLDWPGNVRELRNLIERLTVTISEIHIDEDDLPAEYRRTRSSRHILEIPLGETLEKVEALVIRKTLAEVTSHREKAALILGISPRALHYKLRRYGLLEE